MTGDSAVHKHGWASVIAWAVGAAVLSYVVGTACLMLGAGAALVLEVNASRTVGLAINWAAFILAVVSYSTLLVVAMRYLVRAYDVPWSTWLGLLVYPALWGLSMLAFPDSGLASPPMVVNGIGLAVAWLVVGRRFPGTRSAASPPATT